MASRRSRRQESSPEHEIDTTPPCNLCLGHHVQTSHPSQWKSKESCHCAACQHLLLSVSYAEMT